MDECLSLTHLLPHRPEREIASTISSLCPVARLPVSIVKVTGVCVCVCVCKTEKERGVPPPCSLLGTQDHDKRLRHKHTWSEMVWKEADDWIMAKDMFCSQVAIWNEESGFHLHNTEELLTAAVKYLFMLLLLLLLFQPLWEADRSTKTLEQFLGFQNWSHLLWHNE